jgi:xylulokinase
MVNWFMETLCGVGKADQGRWYQELESSAQNEPSGLWVYPHLVGACHPQWNAEARAHILGLTLNSTRATIYRGILEGIAAEFANNHQILSSSFPAAVREVRVFGGGTCSRLGLRLRAAAAGTRIRQARSREASCLGAAILAGVGAGAFADIREALAHQLGFQEPVEPEPALAVWFKEFRARYNRQFETLLGLVGRPPNRQ